MMHSDLYHKLNRLLFDRLDGALYTELKFGILNGELHISIINVLRDPLENMLYWQLDRRLLDLQTEKQLKNEAQ